MAKQQLVDTQWNGVTGQSALPTEPSKVKSKKQKQGSRYDRGVYKNQELHGTSSEFAPRLNQEKVLGQFGPNILRRTIGGQLEDPTAPTGLDWLNAKNPGAVHSWEEPRRGVVGNPALERRRAEEIMNPVSRVHSMAGDSFADSRYGAGTNALAPLFAGSGMPVSGADPTNPLTLGERGQVSGNISNAFAEGAAHDMGPFANIARGGPQKPFDPNQFIAEQQRLAGHHPMSSQGKIPGANFDLFNGGPDAAAMQQSFTQPSVYANAPSGAPSTSPLPTNPVQPQNAAAVGNQQSPFMMGFGGQTFDDSETYKGGLRTDMLKNYIGQLLGGIARMSQGQGFQNQASNWQQYSPLYQR